MNTWSNDRFWRKNRRKGKLCDGVDLNRNYNIRWGGVSEQTGLIFHCAKDFVNL